VTASFTEKNGKPNFIRYWVCGFIFAISLILANFSLITDVAPLGVVNQQVAGTSAQIDTSENGRTKICLL